MRPLFSLLLILGALKAVLAAPPPITPYIPLGGLGTGDEPPEYVAMSDFDWQSLVSRT